MLTYNLLVPRLPLNDLYDEKRQVHTRKRQPLDCICNNLLNHRSDCIGNYVKVCPCRELYKSHFAQKLRHPVGMCVNNERFDETECCKFLVFHQPQHLNMEEEYWNRENIISE